MIIFNEKSTIFTDKYKNIICIPATHINFDEINKELREGSIETATILGNVEGTIKKVINESNIKGINIKDGNVYYGDNILSGYISNLIISLYKNNLDYLPLKRFLENLMENISQTSINELFEFLEFSSLPITDDGHFIAYKKLTHDFKDIYTGNFDNSVGQILEMPREEVNSDRHKTCSEGFHFASKDYLKYYGAHSVDGCRIVLVKINPKDVVSIPADYDNTKGRCCRYEVIADITEEFFDIGDYDYKIDSSPVYEEPEPECIMSDAEKFEEYRNLLIDEEITIDEFFEQCKDMYFSIDNEITNERVWRLFEFVSSNRLLILKSESGTLYYLEDDSFNQLEVIEDYPHSENIDEICYDLQNVDKPKNWYDSLLKLINSDKSKVYISEVLGTSPRTLGRWVDGIYEPTSMIKNKIINWARKI